MRTEAFLTAAILFLVIVFAIAAQTGWLRPALIGGALFGSAAGIDVPALENPAMIRRGAAHYERFCAGCHASPDRPDLGEELALTPPPPKLHLRVEGWPPEFLFSTVRNGIEHTAMPAWLAQNRDDEVWDMIAFLGVLPELTVAAYRQLAGLEVPVESIPPVALECVGCHGVDGRGEFNGAFPRLDIQTEEYLLSSLKAFREGTRHSGFMQDAVAGLRDEELAELAAFFAGTPVAPSRENAPAIISDGLPFRKVPACAGCHGPPRSVRAEFPNLIGQYEPYLLAQLRLFAEGRRGGGAFAPLMHAAVMNLTEADMLAAASWFGNTASE